MDEYVCIYASGTMVRDIARSLMEKGLAVRADKMEVFPMYFKNGKIKTGSNDNAVMILAERSQLDEAMNTMNLLNQQWGWPLTAFALPVFKTIGI